MGLFLVRARERSTTGNSGWVFTGFDVGNNERAQRQGNSLCNLFA